MTKRYKHIYGPVSSWRLGRSLGIDAISPKTGKICSFDCVYCQVGKTKKLTSKRSVFVSERDILDELKSLPKVKIDYITFSGAGEPTLAKNLGKLIKAVKKIKKKKVAVITNASLINKKDVQKDLLLADLVMLKLDASSESFFKKINIPDGKVRLSNIIKGLKSFRKKYKGKIALQIMFVKGNKTYARELADLTLCLKPDVIEINTPLRPSGVKPLSRSELNEIKKVFAKKNKNKIKIINVYEARKKNTKPVSKKDTIRRRGKI